jgi:cell division protein FtsB
MRLFMLVLVFLLAVQQYHLWFGKNGLRDNNALKKEVDSIILSNEELKQRNQMMFSEIDDLKRGSEAIEERARNELGLVKEGETFFRIVPKEE